MKIHFSTSTCFGTWVPFLIINHNNNNSKKKELEHERENNCQIGHLVTVTSTTKLTPFWTVSADTIHI